MATSQLCRLLCLAILFPSYIALSLPGRQVTRSKFLSSSASLTFFADLAYIVSGSPDEACAAANDNPRYIESEVLMKYGDDSKGNPRTRGVLVRRFTGDSTGYTFPTPSPVSLVKEWPENPPFTAKDFFRADENDDETFYTLPRLVYHIDEPAVASLTQYYRNNIAAGSSILDICSSWVSHYPLEFPKIMKRISGTGMNPLELMANDQFNDYEARNLNVSPELPYDNDSFDVVTCVVSIDYLIHPIEVLKEVRRVLKPGGKVIISQSNRCFPSKAIAMWLNMNDRQHLELINGYLKYAGFGPAKAFDITASVPGQSYNDPMFIVECTK
jgi:SAM-dependent methyltransferase|eukprot:scaffold2192_cov200-Alexandrium_tamarense.AAC.20